MKMIWQRKGNGEDETTPQIILKTEVKTENMRRFKVNAKIDHRMFNKTSNKTKAINITGATARGGLHL